MILDILSRYSSPAYLCQYTRRPELKCCIAFSTEAKKFISLVSKESSITPNSNIISNLAWSKVSSHAFSASTSTSDLVSFASTSTITSDLSYSVEKSTSTSDLSFTNNSSTSTSDLLYTNDNSTSTSDLLYTNDNSSSTSDLLYTNESSTSTSDLLNTNESSTSTSDLLYSNESSTSTPDLLYSNESSTSTSDLLYTNSTSTSDLFYSNDVCTSTFDLSCSNHSFTSTSELCKHIGTSTSTNLITTFCRDVHTCMSPTPIDPTSMKRFSNGVTRAHTPSPVIFSSDTPISKAATYLTSKKLDNSSNVLSQIDGAFLDTSPRPSKTALIVSPGIFSPPPSLYICRMEESRKQTHYLVCPFTGSPIQDIRLQDIAFTKVGTRDDQYKCLGTGITSAVFEGRVVINNSFESVAVKLFKEPFDNLEGISAEAGLLKMLETTGITPKLFGILQRTAEGNHPGIVQELVQNSITLHQLIVGQSHFITKQKWYNIAYQLAFGLKSINEKGVLINDLKSDNILVNINSEDCRITFIDMGHASFMHGKRFPMTTEEASIYTHLAPEIASGEETSESSEIFALGWIFKSIPLKELSFISHKCLSKFPLLRPSVYDILNFVEEIM